MGELKRIDRLLTISELNSLFAIPYSEFIFARDVKSGISLANFYKLIREIKDLDLVEMRECTRVRRARSYRRTFRYYRVSSNGNGGFVVEVRS